MTSEKPVIPARWRNYLYPVAAAILVVLQVYGYLTQEQVAAWLGVVAALCGLGVATAYRPSRTLPGSE